MQVKIIGDIFSTIQCEMDYCIVTNAKEIVAINFLESSKVKITAIRDSMGYKPIEIQHVRYITEKTPFKSAILKRKLGFNHFYYLSAFRTDIPNKFVITSEQKEDESIFDFLMLNFPFPLLKEWVPYLKECMLKSVNMPEMKYSVIAQDMTRTIKLREEEVCLSDVKVYDLGWVDEEYLQRILENGLRSKKICICQETIPPLVFSGSDDYQLRYGSSAIKELEKQFQPLTELNPIVPGIAMKKSRLFPQQGACVNGAIALRKNKANYSLLVEGMGCGKTKQGLAIPDAYFNQVYLEKNPTKTLLDAYKSGDVNYRVILMAPGHLLNKWKSEILQEIPYATVEILDSAQKVVAVKERGMKRNGREFLLISKDFGKGAQSLKPTPTKMRRKFPLVNICLDCLAASMDETSKKQKELLNQNRPFMPSQLLGLTVEKQKIVEGMPICPECKGNHFHGMYVTETGMHEGLSCPHCGELLMHSSKVQKISSYVEHDKAQECILNPNDFASKTVASKSCYHCGEELWQADVKPLGQLNKKDKKWYKISYVKDINADLKVGKEKRETAFVLAGYEDYFLLSEKRTISEYSECSREYGPRRFSISQYIKKQLNNYFDMCLLDEVHKFEGRGSAQSTAAHALIKASKFTVGMSGTIANGSAGSFFQLLFMLEPGHMRELGYSYTEASLMDFVRAYGTIETSYQSDSSSSQYHKQARGRMLGSPRIRPGINPIIFTEFLLPTSCFLDLSDMSKYLPKLNEHIELVDMPEDVSDAYRSTIDSLKSICKKDEGKGLMGNLLQFGLSFPDKPYNRQPIYSKIFKGEIVNRPQNIDEYRKYEDLEDLLPKERRLVEIVKKELREERNVFIYCSFTNSEESSVVERIQQIVETHCHLSGCTKIITSQKPTAIEREAWLHKEAAKGIKCFICHPKLVETGLDLIWNHEGRVYNFPTLIFYQTTYEMAVMFQASRRSYRLSQTEECRTYWMAYSNTLQAACLEIMGQKIAALSAIQGKFSSDGLAALCKSVDPKVKLAQMLYENDKTDEKGLLEMFDVIGASNNFVDDDTYSVDYEQPKTYFELDGATEEQISILDSFLCFQQEVSMEQKDDKKSNVVQKKKKKEKPVIEVQTTMETISLFTFISSECVMFNNEIEIREPKKQTKKQPIAEGQLSFFDLV